MIKKLFFILFLGLLPHNTSLCMEKSIVMESLADKKMAKALKNRFDAERLEMQEIAHRKKIPLKEVRYTDIEEYRSGRLGPLEIKAYPEDAFDLYLGGLLYTVLTRLGSGREAIVYEIKDAQDRRFALKIYDIKERSCKELLAKNVQKSREYLNIPLIVNTELGYSISPLLKRTYKIHPDGLRFDYFFQDYNLKLNEALAEDGLTIDDAAEFNYMYDENNRLWRIDFGSLRELKSA